MSPNFCLLLELHVLLKLSPSVPVRTTSLPKLFGSRHDSKIEDCERYYTITVFRNPKEQIYCCSGLCTPIRVHVPN